MIFSWLNDRIWIGFIAILILLPGVVCSQPSPQWPEISRQSKPWTRWWWMGSAVNQQDLAANLEQLKNANLGGIEITPIYGVAGYEDQFIDYLSPQWMNTLEYTLQKSDSLGLGVDMATGTGWPFGGPWVGADDASKNVRLKTYSINSGEQLDKKIAYMQEPMLAAVGNYLEKLQVKSLSIDDIKQPVSANEGLQAMALAQVRFKKKLPLQTLMAYSDDGEILNLTNKVDSDGTLDWEAPAGDWKLYAVFMGWHGKMVERAAPGGEGYVIDHFSENAVADYLNHFSKAFSGHDISSLRAFFNDSYEVDDASGEAAWTPRLFEEFRKRRGYDLRNHLPALFGKDSHRDNSRVISDFRETISDLLLERFTKQWYDWAHRHQAIIRDQAHGSPANILDLYAASDIPETEGTDILKAKMASSAAHVTGKKLASSESATWLNEHFKSSLSDVKTVVDRFFISGINHVFYHGTAYSPPDVSWPGWLFYAAVHFQSDNPFWNHFGAFNQYVSRVQSFLQAGQPDNDVLLYYPVYDQWAKPGRVLLKHFDGNIDDSSDDIAFKEAADLMRDEGYTFDFISDRQLRNTSTEGQKIQTEGTAYKTLIVPGVQYMPLETLRHIIDLARSGSTIIMYKGKPQNVPGLANLNDRQAAFEKLINQLNFTHKKGETSAEIKNGKIILGENLQQLLSEANVRREEMTDQGLQFTRRSVNGGSVYFITNGGDVAVDGWISLATKTASAALYDPMHGAVGYARVKSAKENENQVYLQLQPGESCIVKAYHSGQHKPSYNYLKKAGDSVSFNNTWTVHFEKGGPAIPKDVHTDSLISWTKFGGQAVKNFSGSAQYTLRFSSPPEAPAGWMLNLGEVHESANITLNGHDLGTVIGPIYQVFVPKSIIQKENALMVEVVNSMANRAAYLDRNGVKWKKFYNVDFPAHDRKNIGKQGLFDASGWPPEDSGLAGPVTLTPVEKLK